MCPIVEKWLSSVNTALFFQDPRRDRPWRLSSNITTNYSVCRSSTTLTGHMASGLPADKFSKVKFSIFNLNGDWPLGNWVLDIFPSNVSFYFPILI